MEIHMKDFMRVIDSQLQGNRRIHDAPLLRSASEPVALEVQNPLYEVENVQDVTEADDPMHQNVWCDGSRCRQVQKTISGLRFCCIDCPAGETDFCSDCVCIPGQGIQHDATHRLVQMRPTICAVCKGVTRLEVRDADSSRAPYVEFSATVTTLQRVQRTQSCRFCAFVWSALAQCPPAEEWPPAKDDQVKIRLRRLWRNCFQISVVSSRRAEKQPDIEGLERVQILESSLQVYAPVSHRDLSSEPGPELRNALVSKVCDSSGTDEAFDLAKMWLQNCRENHVLCPISSHVVPMRVMDLDGLDQSRIYLRHHLETDAEYSALSYCWGPGSPGLFTTTTNFASHQHDGIPIQDLPRTIRDAIHATKKLGLRYLWVDRLCIIQDSVQDWSHQAALMCHIYSGAAITLSADGSSSSTDGLFQTPQAFSLIEYKPYLDAEGNETPFLLLEDDDHHHSLDDLVRTNSQPIDQRGWTLQERLTSPRVLHFTKGELIWECDTLTECECRRQSTPSRRLGKQQGPETVYHDWRELVRMYTTRALSQETDKLPAFQGLVDKFKQIITGHGKDDEYLAGLWRGDLAAQLAWKPPVPADGEAFMKATRRASTTKVIQQMSEDGSEWFEIMKQRNQIDDWHRTKGYIAPTWSWAHLHGPVSYFTIYPPSPFKSYVDILQAETTPRIPGEENGQLTSGSITLRGFVVRHLTLRITVLGYSDGTATDWCTLRDQEQNLQVEVEVDDVQTVKRERGNGFEEALVLFLGTTEAEINPGTLLLGLSRPRIFENYAKWTDEPIPDELAEAFQQPPGDTEERWYSYLVLAESKTQPDKYERLGCLLNWGAEAETMRKVFARSTKSEITMI
ncbi:hypothetical protein XA68_12062 [Ophiocordyceps unilateralis]|uniref:Heterokaryon incompatibility domain-containing protein n=1 Tax=Ophiocordyceps unilateralis TaxID=268505 RepID=A0A2A9PFJ7_OPHUN|nr:hypothetical protein XA68_12062 [Ophiocordyceps unilateralis]